MKLVNASELVHKVVIYKDGECYVEGTVTNISPSGNFVRVNDRWFLLSSVREVLAYSKLKAKKERTPTPGEEEGPRRENGWDNG